MKHVFGKLVIFYVFVMAAGCQRVPDSPGSYNVRIPIDRGDGVYTLQTVTIPGVRNLQNLESESVVIRSSGTLIKSTDFWGRTTLSVDFGMTPQAHFIKTPDYYFPADFGTTAMTAALYHFSKIREFYDKVRPNETKLEYPVKVMFHSSYQIELGFLVYTFYDNAVYEPAADIFAIVPRNSSKTIPLAFNGGVLGHEFFHRIFVKDLSTAQAAALKANPSLASDMKAVDSLVSRIFSTAWAEKVDLNVPILTGDSDTQLANDFLMAALNEGFADYFGGVYSGNPRYIMSSLPDDGFRDLRLKKRFDKQGSAQKAWIVESVKPERRKKRLSHHLFGAYFSNFVQQLERKQGSTETLRQIMKFSKDYASAYIQNRKIKFMSTTDILNIYFTANTPNADACKVASDSFYLDELPPCKLFEKSIEREGKPTYL